MVFQKKPLKRNNGNMKKIKIKPEDVPLHELIGLECKVVSSPNKYQIGLCGKIIDETKNLLILENERNEIKKIEKKGRVFRLKFADKIIEILGDDIIGRSENRIKKKYKKW